MDTQFGHPERLGKYVVKSVLGKGGMGIVYKGFDPKIERTVALKTIRKELLGESEADTIVARFQQEARAAGRLIHPNIIVVYDYGEDEENIFIAMEFVKGRELEDFFDKRESFDIADVVRIMSQLLDALAYSHQNGVVHRDIKPSNILLTPTMQIKVMDFGIARMESSKLTKTGMQLGTFHFMSPEQFEGERVDGRSDIFSAGIILYQLITGERPFDGRSMASTMHKVLSVEPENPSILNLNLPSAFDDVIRKALAKKADERFQTAKAFSEAIQKAEQGEFVDAPEESGSQADETQPVEEEPDCIGPILTPGKKIRPLPVYMLIDCSSSMNGEAISVMNQVIRELTQRLADDPSTHDGVWFSLVRFDSTPMQLIPLSPVRDYTDLPLKAQGSSNLGRALDFVSQCVRQDRTQIGDQAQKPLVYLMSDGNPTDGWEEMPRSIGREMDLIACGVGSDVNQENLKRLTDEPVVHMRDMSPETIDQLMDFLSVTTTTTIMCGSGEKVDTQSIATRYDRIELC